MSAIYNGYTVLSLKFNENCTENFIFLKKHSVRDQANHTPKNRTVFVQGLPPYCTKDLLKSLFNKFGKTQGVYVHSKPTVKNIAPEETRSKFFKPFTNASYKIAYVAFQNESSVNQILNLPVNPSLILTSNEDKQELNVGLRAWKSDYNESVVDKAELQAEIDKFMLKWDKEAEEKKKKEVASVNAVDQDGWEVVTRKGRNPGIARKESVNKQILQSERKKRSRKQLLNFYTFQIKESKMNHLESLRQKLEEDKNKIDLLKQSRRFKPFWTLTHQLFLLDHLTNVDEYFLTLWTLDDEHEKDEV